MYTFMDFNHQKFDAPLKPHSINILGMGFDGTACYRTGQRIAPKAIRDASINLEGYSLNLDRDLEDFADNIVDLGDLPYSPNHFPTLMKNFQCLDLRKDTKLLCLGGEHSISYMPISWYLKNYPDLTIIHLDAHADFRSEYLGHEISHASVIGQLEKKFSAHQHLIQFGIRSGTKLEFDYIKNKGYLELSLENLLRRIESLPAKAPVYFTLDLDFFDPSQLPGTGTPEAGGHDYQCFEKILKCMSIHTNIVGADIVELCPQIDPTGRSECMASKITREILIAMAS